MPGFTYFLPDRAGANAAALAELGLGYAFADGDPMAIRQARGPEDLQGVLVSRSVAGEVGYFPERQVWTKAPCRGGSQTRPYWIGFEKTKRPGPDDLKRATVHGFYHSQLGDGRRWTVPTALLADGKTSPLPKVRKLKADGSIERCVSEPFQPLVLLADHVRESILSAGKVAFTERDEWAVCLAALSLNYRVSADEVSILGLLTDEAVNLICWALVDRYSWADFQAALEAKNG